MRVFISIFLLLSVFTLANAQNIERLEAAFTNGNAAYIGGNFSSEVEISINRENKKLSGKEGQNQLQSFFAKHRPNQFSNVHKGASGRNGTGYLTGDLDTQSGKFRVFIYFEEGANSMKIKEIRIDKL